MKKIVMGLALCALAGQGMAQENAPGLSAEFFEMQAEELTVGLADFPDVPTGQKATVARADATVNLDSTQEAVPGTELVENFYVRWTGKIRIAKEATYTFTTESDDGSRLLIDGKQVVDNGGVHGAQEATGDVKLTAGDHDIKIEFFEAGGDALMKASWSGGGVDREIIPAKVLFHKKDGQDALQPGLWAEYFEASALLFPILPNDRTPVKKKVDTQVNYEQTADNFEGTNLSENFYVRWTGKINIPTAGKWIFYTESDDGSRLKINGKTVVANGGAHAMQEASGDVQLTAGMHDIVIEYYEIGGDAGMKASWNGPGVEKEIIPAKAFSHKK